MAVATDGDRGQRPAQEGETGKAAGTNVHEEHRTYGIRDSAF